MNTNTENTETFFERQLRTNPFLHRTDAVKIEIGALCASQLLGWTVGQALEQAAECERLRRQVASGENGRLLSAAEHRDLWLCYLMALRVAELG